MKINREHFEHWLLSQDPARKFKYWESGRDQKTGCLLCNFFRETISQPHCTIGTDCYSFDWESIPFPDWLMRLMPPYTIPNTFTAGVVQARYRELFPDTTPEPTPAIAEAVRK